MGRLREAMACLGKAGIDLLDAVFTLNGYNLDVQLEDSKPDFGQAVRKLQDMLGWIGTPDDEMRAEYRRLALFLLGRVCRLWADEAPGGKARLEEGEDSLKKLLDEAEATRTRFIGPRNPEGEGEGEGDDVRPDDVFHGAGHPVGTNPPGSLRPARTCPHPGPSRSGGSRGQGAPERHARQARGRLRAIPSPRGREEHEGEEAQGSQGEDAQGTRRRGGRPPRLPWWSSP